VKVPLIDRLFRRQPPPEDERLRKDAEVSQLSVESAATLRRVNEMIRIARVDAEIDARRGRLSR
jgi:hypothetical protein